jgi:hypothetical protein
MTDQRPAAGDPGAAGGARAVIDQRGGPDQRVTADEPTSGRPLSIRSAGPATPLYKGEPLDADRGPGLGCFWSQVVVLAILVVLTPIGVANAWPFWLTGGMLILTILLLLFAGQTVIFLLRLVAADRRTRRRPLRSATPTVGDLEEAEPHGPSAPSPAETGTPEGPGGSAAMRQ